MSERDPKNLSVTELKKWQYRSTDFTRLFEIFVESANGDITNLSDAQKRLLQKIIVGLSDTDWNFISSE